jgi:hypothetical protein
MLKLLFCENMFNSRWFGIIHYYRIKKLYNNLQYTSNDIREFCLLCSHKASKLTMWWAASNCSTSTPWPTFCNPYRLSIFTHAGYVLLPSHIKKFTVWFWQSCFDTNQDMWTGHTSFFVFTTFTRPIQHSELFLWFFVLYNKFIQSCWMFNLRFHNKLWDSSYIILQKSFKDLLLVSDPNEMNTTVV